MSSNLFPYKVLCALQNHNITTLQHCVHYNTLIMLKNIFQSNLDFDSSELMERIQDERRTALREACKKQQQANVCPSKEKAINGRLFYSKQYKVSYVQFI